MSLGPYASFIVTSYALVTFVVIALIVWIALDYRRQQERLRDLEAKGAKRRSSKSSGKSK
ncbi:MAG: heme exporter protein CcmD [Pseudomonadota bacterium]